MKRYLVELTGTSPLLMHGDDIEWRDQIEEYRKKNKKSGKAGDDRSPAFSWIGYAYHDGNVFGLPSDNLMTCIRDGATNVVVSGKKTFKAQSQSGIMVDQILWPITINGVQVPWAPFEQLLSEEKFDVHKAAAREHGFQLFVKPAKVGQSKHIRVRPRFDKWTAAGTITVLDDMITKEILEEILEAAGAYCGIGDWRAKSPKSPGPFGKFTAKVREIKNA